MSVGSLLVRLSTHAHIENMFSRIQSIYLGVHGSLFMAANADNFDCLHMDLNPWQR